MQNHVAYLRVGHQKQAASGLGLEAQADEISRYVASVGGYLIATFTEVESGRRSDRPELMKALALARESGASLVVAQLDRLSQNAAFVSALLDAGVDFRAVDFPKADRKMIELLAALGEYELSMISRRTKAALARRRARGFALGNPKNLIPGRSPAPAMNRERARAEAEAMRPIVDQLRQNGIRSVRGICNMLNARQILTSRGGRWHTTTVSRLLSRISG